MSAGTPRLRMFAGPNGSGKTTVKNGLSRPDTWFGIYINPDEFEKSIRESGSLSISSFELTIETTELSHFFAASSLLQLHGLQSGSGRIQFQHGQITFPKAEMNSYYASVLADFVRRKALRESRSFSFETVMSARDKVALLDEAQRQGFRTYLYYVATEDPRLNVERVKQRVIEGGHDVPEDKIVSRYYRSLQLLPEAVRAANRAFLFDTSDDDPWYFAEVTDGNIIELKSDEFPNWFQPVWDQT